MTTSQLHNKPKTGMKDAKTLSSPYEVELNIGTLLFSPTMRGVSVVANNVEALRLGLCVPELPCRRTDLIVQAVPAVGV